MDVQQEISFCTVAEKSLDRFPPGSVLEQIPLGSISHLVSPEIKASVVGAAQISELEAYVSSILKRNARPIAAVFSLRNMPNLEKARGTAFVNKALASMFEAIRSTFPLPAKVCHVEPDKIAVVAQIDSKTKYTDVVQKVATTAEHKMSNLIELSAGVYAPNEKLKTLDGDQSTLKPEKALNYARYAAVASSKSDKPIEFFTPATAASIISSHRNQKTHAEGMADYEALHELGVEYALFENQVALSALETDKEEFALAHIQRAVALAPNNPVLKANLAYIQYWFDQNVAAHETFVRLHAEHSDFELDNVYVGPEALVAFAAFKQNSLSISIQALKDLLSNAMPLASSGRTAGRSEIPQALAELSKLPAATTPSSTQQEKPEFNLSETWAKLLEAVGGASAFARAYLLEAQPVSFTGGAFVIGFRSEFEDHLALVDNERNKSLITTKLREMGLTVTEVKFVKL